MIRTLTQQTLACLGIAFSFGTALGAKPVADSSVYAVIPRPAVLTPAPGHFRLTARTTLRADPAFIALAERFSRDIAHATGFVAPVTRASSHLSSRAAGAIVLLRVTGRDTLALGAEGYTLDVTPTGVTVRAAHAAGAFYALESFRQLLPAAIYRSAPIGIAAWQAPAVHIEDVPRFVWRGAHLDVGRHFMPKEFVKKYIDLLAHHKMNRFHWHLTEDQGWRIEILKYPRLTEVGACRAQTLVGPFTFDLAKRVFDGVPHCGYYTQDDVREIVAYAAERFVTIVPEIEMPGHVQAAIAAYPWLGVRRDTTVDVLQVWHTSEFILNPSDSAVTFMQDVLREVMTLFPGQYIHIGGDEAGKSQWKASEEVQERIKSLGLKDEHEMQSWFIRQMDAFLTKNNRRLIGWDEILEGGLAENATVMSWRGTVGGIAAARANHDVVMAPGSHTYFDHYQSLDKGHEPLAIGGYLPIDTAYAFEPIPAVLTPQEATHILGAQAQLWTEYIRDPKELEYMAFPRMSALAEALWSAKSRRDFGDFMQRLPAHLQRLDALDVRYRKLETTTAVP
jgi:hexosaminidase